jgi:hypothetical protein
MKTNLICQIIWGRALAEYAGIVKIQRVLLYNTKPQVTRFWVQNFVLKPRGAMERAAWETLCYNRKHTTVIIIRDYYDNHNS